MTYASQLSPAQATHLAVARAAAKLFLEKGFTATSGADIAAAIGVSERTIWRWFRNKESCIEPLVSLNWKTFAGQLRRWPLDQSIEQYLAFCYDLSNQSAEEITDGVLIVRLIAALPEHPDLRPVWLQTYHDGEDEMVEIIGDRLGLSHKDFDVKLCAAAVMGAIRTVDETISVAAIRHGQKFEMPEIVTQMSRAIRAVSNLPFCDPVTPKPFGDRS